jgi:protease IV
MTDQNDVDSMNRSPPADALQGHREGGAGAPGWERATLEKLAFAALNEQRAARRW